MGRRGWNRYVPRHGVGAKYRDRLGSYKRFRARKPGIGLGPSAPRAPRYSSPYADPYDEMLAEMDALDQEEEEQDE